MRAGVSPRSLAAASSSAAQFDGLLGVSPPASAVATAAASTYAMPSGTPSAPVALR
ncbi:MAG: hypothetical protein IPN32_20995 [Deltaproteobacteria bacterium]|nr:hypothetical protein [Deltaproteobacteria bacterium]